jgi:hypothetical protein
MPTLSLQQLLFLKRSKCTYFRDNERPIQTQRDIKQYVILNRASNKHSSLWRNFPFFPSDTLTFHTQREVNNSTRAVTKAAAVARGWEHAALKTVD